MRRCQKIFQNKKRCANHVLAGEKYCEKHKKPFKHSTYAFGQRSFEGQRTVEPEKYHEYIASPEWKEKAKKARERSGNSCVLCHDKGLLHVHHNTYVRLGNERDGDLTVLCDQCHKLFHQFYEYDGRVGHFVPKVGLLNLLRRAIPVR